MFVTIRRGFSLLGVLALVGCGAPSDPSPVVAPEARQAATASRSQPPQVPKIDWVPCGEEFPGTECGVAEVPLDYDNPHGATTWIALARIPAADQANRIGTVFLNPGGPGGSGVDLVLIGAPDFFGFSFGTYLASVLHGRFDIVGFDPRGVARSEPLRCFDTMDDFWAWYAVPLNFPYLKTQERPFFDYMSLFSDICLTRDQRIAAHMSTADVARDLDLLRQAVGDAGLTYLGFSYGSYIGETYARLFPNKVRALVIDGVIDPRAWVAGLHAPLYDSFASAKEFKEMLRLCDEAYAVDPSTCALGGPEGAAVRFGSLAATLKKGPVEFPDGSVVTYDFLIVMAVQSLYVPEWWIGPDGYVAFFGYLADAVLGDRAALERAATARHAIEERLRTFVSRQEPYDNTFDSSYGNMCADVQTPQQFEVWSAMGGVVARESALGPFWWWGGVPCANWPVNQDRFVGPWEGRTSAPVLVVGSYFDGVTSYDSAVATSTLLQNSRLLSYAGWGHTAFTRTDCVTNHVASYLLDGTLPRKGTVCPAPPNPFLPSPMLRAAPAKPLVGLPPTWLLRR